MDLPTEASLAMVFHILATRSFLWDLSEVFRTSFRLMISPFDFLTFLNFIKKYQNLDFATTVFGAKMRMR